jgi:hypothetical protein
VQTFGCSRQGLKIPVFGLLVPCKIETPNFLYTQAERKKADFHCFRATTPTLMHCQNLRRRLLFKHEVPFAQKAAKVYNSVPPRAVHAKLFSALWQERRNAKANAEKVYFTTLSFKRCMSVQKRGAPLSGACGSLVSNSSALFVLSTRGLNFYRM